MAKKLKGPPTKLDKRASSTKKTKQDDQPTGKPKKKRKYDANGFTPITFHIHQDDIEPLDKIVEDWASRSTVSPVTITRLLRLAIRQLREKDLERLLD